jgi:hypothetical protein
MVFKKGIVAIDDNREQYCLIDLDDPTPYPPLTDSEIHHFIVPLPRHVYLEAQRVLDFLDSILPKLLKLSSDERLLYRTYLTSANSFKSVIRKDREIPNATKQELLRIALPHFIWACELYYPSDYPQSDDDGICRGLVLIDATGKLSITRKNIPGVIKIINIRQNAFKMKAYRHNLTGGW